MTKDTIYKLGYDCGLNGANTTNCDFRIFSTPENTKEWERGNKDGEMAKSELRNKLVEKKINSQHKETT